jgi:hypothetical protein
MLTEEGNKRRFWGPLVTLRQLLEDKSIPDHYYGPASVCDNVFAAISRILELSVLVRENSAAIIEAANRDPQAARLLVDELDAVRSMLQGGSSQLDCQREGVTKLLEEVHQAASRPNSNREDTST